MLITRQGSFQLLKLVVDLFYAERLLGVLFLLKTNCQIEHLSIEFRSFYVKRRLGFVAKSGDGSQVLLSVGRFYYYPRSIQVVNSV